MTKVKIEFDVPKRIYDQYESLVQEFEMYLNDLRIQPEIIETEEE